MPDVKPICPRCGYDLEGLIATWIESCPMSATCSECGLEFDCSRALSPRLIGPRWSYEHSLHALTGRWWATSIMALFPRRMFRDLAVDHWIKPRRLVRFILLWLLAIHLSVAVIGISLALITGTLAPMRFPGSANFPHPDFWYQMIPRLLLPLRYPLAIPNGPGSSTRVPLQPLFLLVFLPTFLMSAWMLLLGSSMRLARIRRLQILRGVAYSLPCAAAYLGLAIAAIIAIPTLAAYTGFRIPPVAVGAVIFACFVHHLFWWYLFIRRYLRIRHAAAVVILYTVKNVLVLMIVFVLLSSMGLRF